MNAICFKGAWTQPFDPNQTAAAPFTQLDGSSVSCEKMQLTGTFDYFTGATFQALRMPYGTNSRMSMLILLPNSSTSLAELVASLTPQALNGWISELQPTTGGMALPRFTATYGTSLIGSLSALGMGVAFSPADADFSGIAPGPYLSDVEHKTVVEVDESGTVAAGGTSGTISITAAPTPQFQMTMDHPFFYAIRDDDTGALLFIGTGSRARPIGCPNPCEGCAGHRQRAIRRRGVHNISLLRALPAADFVLDPGLRRIVDLSHLKLRCADRRADGDTDGAGLLQQPAPRPVVARVMGHGHDHLSGFAGKECAAAAVLARLAPGHACAFGEDDDP